MRTETKYTINCTGDAVKGDEIMFEKSMFEGSYPNSRFVGTETICGKITKDSYGASKQQHTFTIEGESGDTFRIKGRNLYKNGCYRKEWTDESKRNEVLDDKHNRGGKARKEREVSKNPSYYIAGSPGWYYPVCNICGMEDEEMAASERDIVPCPSCNC